MSYAHPEIIVDTNWVQQHLNDPKVRIAEVDYDATANYNLGHVPGAVLFDWKRDLNHPLERDILSREQLEQLFSASGISPDTKIVLYGDFNNWFAAYAFWDLQYYGVENVVLMNGGRKKWIDEDKPLTKDLPTFTRTNYKASGPDENIRVFYKQTVDLYRKPNVRLVDVVVQKSSPERFSRHLNIRRNTHNAEATSPAPSTYPGPRQSKKTGRSRASKTFENCTRTRELLPTETS